MRMLMNNLDPEVAERPDDLVVYGGRGQAALPSWSGAPLTVVVTLEENNTFLAKYIGENLLDTATSR